MFREHGSRQRYYHEAIGVNSRLDALQAAVLQVKLPHLDRWNRQRAEVAARYQELLANVPGIITPQGSEGGKCVWNQYTIRVIAPTGVDPATHRDSGKPTLRDSGKPTLRDSGKPTLRDSGKPTLRDRVRSSLQEAGVISMIYYPLPLHLQEVYRDLGYSVGSFPITEQVSHEVLSLPMFPELTFEEQQRVVYALKDAL
jgi:dTDP-4-amino-4,6-dideoxygalactose transaminase